MRDVNTVLEIIKNGTLDANSPYDYPEIIQNSIHVQLMRHQLQSIYAMSLLENKENRENKDEYVVTEIGILSNKVGSGKSLCILGLIAKQPELCSKDVVKECHGDMYVMENRINRNTLPCNLIVVPTHLQRSVWIPYLKQINLSYVVVTKDNIYDSDLSSHIIVLCSAKYYNVLMKRCDWVWSRVVFDEADTISIPACIKPNTNFVWFNTSSIQNLLFYQGYYWKYNNGILTRITTRGITNQGYIKNTFRNLKDCSLVKTIIVKCNDAYIDECLQLPSIVYHTCECKLPYYLRVVGDIVPEHVLSHIHGDDMNGAMNHFYSADNSNANIISSLLSLLHNRLTKFELKKEYLTRLHSSLKDDLEIQNKIDKNNQCIHHTLERLETITKRINNVASEEVRHTCPICMETTKHDNTCIFSCCLNLFCTECINKVIQYDITHCPLCRTKMTYDTIFKIRCGQDHENSSEKMYDKSETLLKLVINIHNQNMNNYRIIIFALYEESIMHIQTILHNHGMSFKTLRGTNLHNIMNWFISSQNCILIVNAQLYGNGLNMNNTTHIIMYQEFTPDITMQVIGRAHRIGTSQSLNVYTLKYST
tara:strand:+ start:5268 stop:7046 length:1779 start_codon:yes stop_codon:yes gene_type:complete